MFVGTCTFAVRIAVTKSNLQKRRKKQEKDKVAEKKKSHFLSVHRSWMQSELPRARPRAPPQPSDPVLPRLTAVRIAGNNRTKTDLINRVGTVRSAQTLGGWHEVQLANNTVVRVQRNALEVLKLPPGNNCYYTDPDNDISDNHTPLKSISTTHAEAPTASRRDSLADIGEHASSSKDVVATRLKQQQHARPRPKHASSSKNLLNHRDAQGTWNLPEQRLLDYRDDDDDDHHHDHKAISAAVDKHKSSNAKKISKTNQTVLSASGTPIYLHTSASTVANGNSRQNNSRTRRPGDPVIGRPRPIAKRTATTSTSNLPIATSITANIAKLNISSLRKYRRYYNLDIATDSSRDDLIRAVRAHFVKTPVNESEVISLFVRRAKQARISAAPVVTPSSASPSHGRLSNPEQLSNKKCQIAPESSSVLPAVVAAGACLDNATHCTDSSTSVPDRDPSSSRDPATRIVSSSVASHSPRVVSPARSATLPTN